MIPCIALCQSAIYHGFLMYLTCAFNLFADWEEEKAWNTPVPITRQGENCDGTTRPLPRRMPFQVYSVWASLFSQRIKLYFWEISHGFLRHIEREVCHVSDHQHAHFRYQIVSHSLSGLSYWKPFPFQIILNATNSNFISMKYACGQSSVCSVF